MLNKTYRNGQGRFQKEYNELETDINFIWTRTKKAKTKKTKNNLI